MAHYELTCSLGNTKPDQPIEKQYELHFTLKYKGNEYHTAIDLSPECDEKGVLPQTRFNYWVRAGYLPLQGLLYDLKAIRWDEK